MDTLREDAEIIQLNGRVFCFLKTEIKGKITELK